MKLCLLTFNMARDLELDRLIESARAFGYAAVEFRVDAGHKHGVELERTKKERCEIKRKLEDNYLPAVSIATGHRFESPDKRVRKNQIDGAKRYIELASDIDCPRIRVFGNNIPEGVKADDCVKWVGESVRELAEFGTDFNVEVCLEMHGQFNFWKYALNAVKKANHFNTGIVYNCDDRDIISGSVRETYGYVKDYISHIHMHDLDSGFPYVELFKLLLKDGYTGYLSSEAKPTDDPEKVLSLYAELWRAYLRQAELENKLLI